MNKIYLHTNKLTKQLKNWKTEQEMLRVKRAELMTRLFAAGFSLQEIGDIYGCERQYVDQIIKEHASTNITVSA